MKWTLALWMTGLLLGAMGCSSENGSFGAAGMDGTGPAPSLSFFVTSVGSGPAGGNLGGLEGADATCQSLADAVGAGNRTWRAYLSTAAEDARDRIGTGPWYNALLHEVAPDVQTLHDEEISRLEWFVTDDPAGEGHVRDENGALVPLSDHDIITGSTKEGTVFEGKTCLDWTSASEEDVAQVGHSDLAPPGVTIGGPDRLSWNSAHDTVSCTEQGLAERQGAGRFYCFAAD